MNIAIDKYCRNNMLNTLGNLVALYCSDKKGGSEIKFGYGMNDIDTSIMDME